MSLNYLFITRQSGIVDWVRVLSGDFHSFTVRWVKVANLSEMYSCGFNDNFKKWQKLKWKQYIQIYRVSNLSSMTTVLETKSLV